MIRRTSVLVLATALAARPLAAQPSHFNLRLAQGQPARFVPPLCNLSVVNGKVEKARTALKKAYEVKTPAEKSAQLTEAKMNLLTAISQEAQATNSAAWYYMARVALLEGDPVGADTAFTKAQELAPSCELDITQYRQKNWALLGTAGLDLQRAGKADSAMVQFRDASALFRGMPHVYTNMGVMFANLNQDDSAAVYFAKALAIAEADSTMVEDRNAVALNLALMYQRLNKYPDAIALLHKYLRWKPDDTDAQKSLAIAFRNAGMADSSDAIESAMISRFSQMNLDSLDSQDLMSVGVVAFNKNRYGDAAGAFGRLVKRNPLARDANYNLANTYLAMATQAHDSAEALRKLAKATKNPSDAIKAQLADTARLDAQAAAANSSLIGVASKLLEMEPMNEDDLRLLAQGQRSLGQTDAVIKTATRLVSLPFGVEATLFQISQAGAKFTADATGRSPTDAAGKPLKTAPLTLVFEFIDANGAVIDSKEATIAALALNQKQAIELEAKGAAIVGWRYRIKPS